MVPAALPHPIGPFIVLAAVAAEHGSVECFMKCFKMLTPVSNPKKFGQALLIAAGIEAFVPGFERLGAGDGLAPSVEVRFGSGNRAANSRQGALWPHKWRESWPGLMGGRQREGWAFGAWRLAARALRRTRGGRVGIVSRMRRGRAGFARSAEKWRLNFRGFGGHARRL